MPADCGRVLAALVIAVLAACPSQKSAPSVSSSRAALGPVPAQWKRVPVLLSRTGHAMAALGDRVVLFGGMTGTGPSDETWEFDGATWTLKNPPIRPPARMFAAMGTLGNRAVLFGGDGFGQALSDTWEWDGTTWTERFPSASPSEADFLTSSAMAQVGSKTYLVSYFGFWVWDGTSWSPLPAPPQAMVLSGYGVVATQGQLHVFSSQSGLWNWDGLTWTLVDSARPMGARAGFGLAALGQQVVLFSGCAGAGTWCPGLELEDTWVWDGAAWNLAPTASHPSGRSQFQMASLGDHVVLFGGECQSNVTCADTWSWDGINWSLAAAGVSPRDRLRPATTSWNGNVVLFGGGFDNGSHTIPSNDTWVFNGQTWTVANPSTSPGPRLLAAMAAQEDGVVLFGGSDNTGGSSQILGDTWKWDGTSWSQFFPATSPSPRYFSSTMASVGNSHVLLFSGETVTGGCLETWEWDGVTWAQRFPPTTPNSAGMPRMAGMGKRALLVQGTSLWEWDGNDWHQRPSIPAIPSDADTFIARRGAKAILLARFSTTSGTTLSVLEWDGLSWTSRNPSGVPSRFNWVNAWVNSLEGVLLATGNYSGFDYDSWIYTSGFAVGSPCSSHADCDLGYCVDGVCCDSLCGDSDPTDCQACSVAAGGSVDGKCTLFSPGTICRAASCTNATFTSGGACTGDPVCPSAQPVACAPYVCRGDACGTDCALQADCASGFLCKAPRCVAKSDDGAACSSEIECASGFCVDSVCCDSACPGRCEACDAPGSRGV